MKLLNIPAFLHEVFGERQTIAAICVILLFGGSMTAALRLLYPELTDGLPVWRSALALALIFDVCAGCAANFTASTSNFYAQRRTHRIVFIAVHLHIVLIALLLGVDLTAAVAVWAYTVCGAAAVNALIGQPRQRFIAGLLLAIGVGGVTLLPSMQPYMVTASLLFMLKVLYGFAVDHYGRAGSRSSK